MSDELNPPPDGTVAQSPAEQASAASASASTGTPAPSTARMSDELNPPDGTVAQSPADQARAATASTTATPATCIFVPGYEILEELGRGGMGVVHKARQTGLNRFVALKMVIGQADGEAVARFLAEAEAVAAIRHPNVVQVYDYGEHAGRPYMALEYLSRGTLSDRLKGGQRLDARVAAALAEKIARGVQAAHSQGITHRDIKPGNVLFDELDEPKVADFGLARRAESELTRTGAVMGTPAYMAPEQAGGHTDEVGPGVDIWAIGVILYESLTGQRPFVADRTDELLVKVLMSDPDPLRSRTGGIPRDLETICLKCLEKQPARRYSSALALAQDLERYRAGEPILARPDGVIRKMWRRTRKRALTLALAVALLTALGIAASLLVRSGADRRESDLTRRINEGLEAGEWPVGHRSSLDEMTEELAAVAPVQATAARKRLTERVAKRFRESLSRPRVEPADVPAFEADVAWITARDAELGTMLGSELRARLRTWNPVLELAAPFPHLRDAFAAELVAAADGRLTRTGTTPPAVPTLISSRGPLRAEVEFAPGWEDGTALGLVVHLPTKPGENPSRGYTFRLAPMGQATGPESAPGILAATATFRTAGGGARAEIVRDGAVLRALSMIPAAGPLRLSIQRVGTVLRFWVNEEPPLEFEDAFPLSGDEGTVLGLLWPKPVALNRLQIENQILPPSASPLERADSLFDRGQFLEAAALYRQASSDAATATEATCKAGMSLVRAKRADEAIPLLEAAAAKPGDRWPVLAVCQLWLLLLEEGKLEEAATAFGAASGRFTPDQLARYVPESTRTAILGYSPYAKVNYFVPDRDLVPRTEAYSRIAKLLNDDARRQDDRYGLMLALTVTGELVRAREVGREVIPVIMNESAMLHGAQDNFPWAMRWYCWVFRQTGRGAEARNNIGHWLREYPLRPTIHSPEKFKQVYMPLHLELARLAADEGNWEEAEAALDTYLKDTPRPIGNYSFYAPAYLMKGFCRLELGDPAGAVRVWAEGRWPAYKEAWTGKNSPTDPMPNGRNALLDHWMLSSLSDKLSEAEAKDLVTALLAALLDDPAMAQLAGIAQFSPEVLRNAWRSPRGRELARKMAFLQLSPVEHYRNMIRVLIYEKLRQDLADGKPTPEQDEAFWQAFIRFGDLFFEWKLTKIQLLPLGLAWKGTAGVLGWGSLAPSVPANARGPLAYVMGLRYLKLNKPADARMLFRTAIADAPAKSPLAQLATAELDKLDGKVAPKSLPIAPPPREK